MKFWCLQISQKNNQILDRFLPYDARAEIFQNLVGFLGDLKTPKFHSEINWDYFHSKMIFFSRFPEYQHSKDVYGCKGRVKDVCDPSFDNVNFNYSDQIKIDCLD